MANAKTGVNLTPFCDYGVVKVYNLTTPFVFDGWKYATDGKIMIRIPCGERNSDLEMRPKHPDEFFDGFKPRSCQDRWDEAPTVVAEKDCPQCDGKGSIPDEDGDDSRCLMCAGLGRMQIADRCVNGKLFANLYDRLILSLPGPVLYSASDEATGKNLIRFVFDGGQGALMGIHEGKAPHAK